MRRLVLAVITLLLAGAALFSWHHDVTPAHAPLALELPVERAWALSWSAHDVTALTGDEVPSTLALSATLRVRRIDAHTFDARLERPVVTTLQFLGQNAPLDPQLLTAVARVTLDDAGRTTTIAFADGTDPLAAHLLSALYDELRVDLSAANEGRDVEEPNRHGLGLTRYQRTLGGFSRLAQEQRSLYGLDGARLTTTGRDDVTWDGFFATRHARRTVEANVREQRLLASTGQLDLEPTTTPALEWPAVASFSPHQRFAVSARAAVAELDQRIGDLDGVKLLDALTRFGPTGQVPNHARFLRQASALLERDPHLCAELERRFFEAAQTEAGRTLTLDLLASAGTPEAQASLRRLLDDARTRSERSWPLWLQRLSLLQRPTKETAAFGLAELERATSRDAVGASSAVVGALSHGLARSEPTLARQFEERLQQGFGQADASARAAWTLALGNTRSPRVLPQLEAAANDTDPRVRTTAAWALGSLEDGSTQTTLSRLCLDLDPRVREAAIHALAQGPFSLPVAAAAIDASPDGRADAAWVNLLAPHLAEPGVREVLVQLLARTTEPSLAGRLRTLLEG